MNTLLKGFYFSILLILHLPILAQDSLSIENLKPLIYEFELIDGHIQGNGLEFLKKELAKAQFTLLGDYPDSKNTSELTTALIPLLHASEYRAMALGVGVPSGRLLDSLSKEPSTIRSKFKKLNIKYSFQENEKTVTPMPDMKSIEDVGFVQKAGEQNWSVVGFGYESWNSLSVWADKMYNQLPAKSRDEHEETYLKSTDFIKELYQNRNGDLLAFYKAVNESNVIERFLKIAATNSKNAIYLTAFKNSIKLAGMYANQQFFEKNKLRINDEKQFLKQELERIDFDIHRDKLLVKWDGNFLSRGFQPYAFYGVGNTLSEIAEYNGSKSLHISVIPRYVEKNGAVQDISNSEDGSSNPLASLLSAGQKNQWTIINLQPIGPGHFYWPRKYLLTDAEEDFIKRFDILIIPPIEKKAKLLID